MEPERLRLVEELLERALKIPSAERRDFLGQACGADLELRSEVESLLAAHDEAGDFMEQPAVGHGIDILREQRDLSSLDTLIGHYRLLRKIGAGGMSEVYLAVRADDEFQKRVALKIVRQDVDREDLVRRFRTERQILAGLDHQNIAKLLDGGTTKDGLPYFVMDYIDGVPIDTYCDQNKLSVRERLGLFRTVCAAVQYAHQNLVVHRDIKASNILVTADGTPKLLDFGIAKLIRPDVFGQQVEHTATWLQPMTPRYASPEQIQGKLVTTSSDVYSLGVLLYKLLTGHFPYQLQSAAPAELTRLILEEDAERPSTTIRSVEKITDQKRHAETTITPELVSRERNTQPQQLERQLKGDLDNIALMALRKEPLRRYASVEQLSEDIRRFLVGLPILARKDTFGYRTTKFIRRNRIAVIAAAAFVIVLVAFSISMAVQASRIAQQRDQARLERDRAEQVIAFMEGIFEVADPIAAKGENITAREILERGAVRVEQDLGDQPEVQATMLEAIGNVYRNLGLYDRARPLVERSLQIREQTFGPDHLAVAQSLSNLGALLTIQGDYAEAEPLLQRALGIREEQLGQEHPAVADSQFRLARLSQEQGDYEAAERRFREAIRIQTATAPEHPSLASQQSYLAILLNESGDFEAAEPLFRSSLELRRRLFGDEHPLVAESQNDYGVFLGMKGDLDRAETMFRDSLALRRKILGDEHRHIAESLANVGRVLKEKGNHEESLGFFREAEQIDRKLLGDEHPFIALHLNNQALALLQLGEFAQAESLAREAWNIRRNALGEEHWSVGSSAALVGHIMVKGGKPGEAEPVLREGLAQLQRSLPPGHWRPGETESYLGECLAALGRPEEAEPLLIRGYEQLRDKRGPDNNRTQAALERVVVFYSDRGRMAQAEKYAALVLETAPDEQARSD